MTHKEIYKKIAAVLTFVTVLIAILIGGFFSVYVAGKTDGKDTNQAATDLYKGQMEASQRELTSAREQITKLKLDLQRSEDPQRTVALARPNCPVDPATLELLQEKTSPAGMSLSVPSGQTLSALDEHLFISVVATSFANSPFRYIATLTLGSPGQASLKMDNVEVGNVIQYQGVELRVLTISAVNVGFSVTRR